MTMDRRDFLTASSLSLLASTALASQAFGQSSRSGSLKEMLDAALSRPVQRGDIPGVVAGITESPSGNSERPGLGAVQGRSATRFSGARLAR
jgi:hypothetical protein